MTSLRAAEFVTVTAFSENGSGKFLLSEVLGRFKDASQVTIVEKIRENGYGSNYAIVSVQFWGYAIAFEYPDFNSIANYFTELQKTRIFALLVSEHDRENCEKCKGWDKAIDRHTLTERKGA